MDDITPGTYEFRMEVMRKLTHLEALVADLAGNGRPGRVGRLEHAVDKLQAFQNRQTGVIVGISSVVSAIAAFLFYVFDFLKLR